MANIPQRDPESTGGEPGHQLTPGDARPYADTDRNGGWQQPATINIMLPQNLVSDPVWGVNAPAGGQSTNTPEPPEIPVAKGE